MDRQIVYPGQILPETSLLQMTKDAMIGLAKLSTAVLGTSTMANGFAVTPTGPASLQVVYAPGEIYSLTSIDALAFSTLPADTTHSILKQGILLDGGTLSCPAPGTTGQSINYLVQVTYQDLDSTPVLLPYYNSANPALPFSGAGNNGLTQNTVRKGVAVVSVKAGASAVTGTQVTPSPDVGYIGLYVVTVAFGQTTITAGSIALAPSAPLINSTLHGLSPTFLVPPVVPPATIASHAVQLGQAGGAARVSGLVGANNTSTPNTQYDFRATSVTLRNAAGAMAVFVNTATITNNILTAGPAVNGRDQAGAFPAAGWVHFWFISDGTNLATLSSLSATSPTLPAGYTYQAYIGAVIMSGSALQLVKFRGAWTNYDTPRTVVAGGTATVDTAFSTANFVPPNALEWRMQVQNLANTATGAGIYSLTLVIDNGYQTGLQGQGAASAVSSVSGGAVNLPNLSQSATYRIVVTAGTGPTTTINAGAYKNPNGGE